MGWAVFAYQVACTEEGCEEKSRACQAVVPSAEMVFAPEYLAVPTFPAGYVAHALGGIDGWAYSNALEAFEGSYTAGFRLFEVDLVLLADGSVLAAHDRHEHVYGLKRTFAELTRSDMAGVKWRKKYTPMFVEALLQELARKPDAWLILDTKIDHMAILREVVRVGQQSTPCALQRVIPHISGHKKALRDIQALYPFTHYMLALYRSGMNDEQVVDFLRGNPAIQAVMMWHDQRYSPAFFQALTDIDVAVYVHSLLSPARIAAFRQNGVGVYSDAPYPHPVVRLDSAMYVPGVTVTVLHDLTGPVRYAWEWAHGARGPWRASSTQTPSHPPRFPGLWLRCWVTDTTTGKRYIVGPIPG